VDPAEAERIVGCDANRQLALQGARETITLLKNENHLLPLNPNKLKTIAVIGPNADRELLGGYSGKPNYFNSVLEGIRAKVNGKIKVPYAEGCKITVGGSWNQDLVTPGKVEEDRKLIAEAVSVGAQADVIVLCLGGNEQTSREAWSLNHMGDRTTLDLLGRQEGLVNALQMTGKPVIVLLFNGSPLAITNLVKMSPPFSNAGISARKPARPSLKFYLAITTPAASCPSPFPVPPVISRPFIITNPLPAVAISSTMSLRSSRSVSA
jgi:beta-glucosidase